MERLIEQEVVREAQKRLARYSQQTYYSQKYQKAYTKRTGKMGKSRKAGLPNSWTFDPHFDPRYCINHSKFIAKGIWNSLCLGTYQPRPSLRRAYPKPDGGVRYIDAFSVPDAAIASIFLRNLRRRNAKVFSIAALHTRRERHPWTRCYKSNLCLAVKRCLSANTTLASSSIISIMNMSLGCFEKLAPS